MVRFFVLGLLVGLSLGIVLAVALVCVDIRGNFDPGLVVGAETVCPGLPGEEHYLWVEDRRFSRRLRVAPELYQRVKIGGHYPGRGLP